MPSKDDSVQQALRSGIEALTLTYEPIHQFATPHIYVRTSMRINSLELGTLDPEQYRYVAQRTNQADHLFQRHLHKLLGKIPEFLAKPSPLQCFTVPAYARMLKNGTLSAALFEELGANPLVSAARIAVELSADLLFEDLDSLLPELERINEMGVGIVLTEVGDPFCPLLRLFQVPYNTAILDPYPLSAGNYIENKVLSGLCDLLHNDGKKVIAVNLPNTAHLYELNQFGCDGYSVKGTVRNTPDFTEDGDTEE